MTKAEVSRLALREIAWAAVDGFRRNHQGAQGILSDDVFDKIGNHWSSQKEFVDTVITMLQAFGLDDKSELERLEEQEYKEIAKQQK